MNPASPAPKDLIEAIKGHVLAGLSAGQIAPLVGKSRHSVIGIVHRHLNKQGIVLEGAKKSQWPRRARVSRAKVKTPELPAAEHFVPRVAEVAAPLNLTLMELHRGQCKWPVNAPPKGGTYFFCGHPAEGPYCPGHAALARGDGRVA